MLSVTDNSGNFNKEKVESSTLYSTNTSASRSNSNDNLSNLGDSPKTALSTQPCQKCGSESLKLGAGKAPHSASLLCGECGKWVKWVGKKDLAEIEKLANSQGCGGAA